jgi:hypothetical protein
MAVARFCYGRKRCICAGVVAASVSNALCLAQNTQPDLAIFDVQLAGKRAASKGLPAPRNCRYSGDFLTSQGDHLFRPVSTVQFVAALETALQREIRWSPGSGLDAS